MHRRHYIFFVLFFLSYSTLAQVEPNRQQSISKDSLYADSLYLTSMHRLQSFSWKLHLDVDSNAYFQEMLHDFTTASEKGHTDAAKMAVRVLLRYRDSLWVRQDTSSGILKDKLNVNRWWILQEAKQIIRSQEARGNLNDDGELLYLYALIYGEEGNKEKQILWIHKSAETGYPPAYNKLFREYRDGENVPQNNTLALRLQQRASECGYGMEYGLINKHYQLEVLKNHQHNSIDTTKAMIDSINLVGKISIVSVELDSAEIWYRRGLSLYDEMPIVSDTMSFLENLYETSLVWFEKAAATKHEGATKETLKIYLMRYLLTPRNFNESYLAKKLSHQLDLSNDGEAMFLFSLVFLNESNNDSALIYLQRAADKDYAPAVYHLAETYRWGMDNNGMLIIPDSGKYAHLRDKACRLGYMKACQKEEYHPDPEIIESLSNNSYENIVKSIFKFYLQKE